MTTLQQTIDSTLFDYLHVTNESRNRLAAAVSDTTGTTISLSYDLAGIAAGHRLSVDLEDMHVWEASGTSATVERGTEGSTAATHAEGATVYVTPRFTAAQILRAVNQEVQSLSADGLYRTGTLDLTSSSSISSYDLTGPPSGFLDVIDVSIDRSGVINDWPLVPLWELRRDADTSEFASGMALIVRGGPPENGNYRQSSWLESGRTLQVRYKRTFSGTLSALTDDVETVTGLWAEAHDLLAIGAAVRLMTGMEVPRSTIGTQDDTRRRQEVPPGAVTQSAAGLRSLRNTRLQEEKRRRRMWDRPKRGVR